MAHPGVTPMVFADCPPTTIIMQPPPPEPKRSACCLIFTAVFLLLSSASQIGGGAYVATKAVKLQYHYAFLISGSISFLTGIVILYSAQDIGRRRGWMIAGSALTIAGIISCLIAIPSGFGALENKEKDCLLPNVDIKPSFEFTLKTFDIGKVKVGWECFDNYETVWQIMIGVAGISGILQGILLFTTICHCIIDCCKKRKSATTQITTLGITGPNTIAYSRLENA